MESILLIIVLAVLVSGYFVTARFGKFLDENFRASDDPRSSGRKVYIDETDGKSAGTVSKEVYAILDSLPEDDDSLILICKKAEPGIIKCLEDAGCTAEFDLPQ